MFGISLKRLFFKKKFIYYLAYSCYYLAYFCNYLRVPLHFWVLFISFTILFQPPLVLSNVLLAKSFQFQLNKLFPDMGIRMWRTQLVTRGYLILANVGHIA